MSEASKTVDKLLAMMIEMSDGAFISPQQLSRRMDINRTVAQRLLTTLFARGYVDRVDGEYALSQRLAVLAAGVQRRTRAAVAPVVHELSRGLQETVVFHVLDGTHTVVLEEAFFTRSTSLQVRHEVGSRSPVWGSASGLAILALMPDDRVKRLVDGDPAPMLDRLATVRATGFAMTIGEIQDGVSGLAIGVRSRGSLSGSIAVLVPTPRVDELAAYRDDLQRAAREIESALD